MKIACVAYLHGAGGAERQIIMLANELANRGEEVHLIILADNNSKYRINQNITIHDLSGQELGNIRILSRYKQLKKILEVIMPDVSIHYWLQSAYFCAIMPKKITGKLIYSERGNPSDKEYRGLLGLVRRYSFTKIDGFVFQSSVAKNYFNKSIQEKSVVIPNSVFIPEGKYINPCRKREKIIINVGRLHPQKNQKMLIKAFSLIHNEFPEYKLVIFGDGELKKELLNLINKLGLNEKIYLYKSVNNILDYVYNASLFILSSNYEGMPNALMEAMAIGVPSISTNYKPGGVIELIDENHNGWIVPINDEVALARKVKYVLSNNNDDIIRHSIQIREKFSSKVIFDKWNKFCHKIFGK